jgi:hypothetical protein
MFDQTYRDPKNFILEGYQPTISGNVDPKRPPRGGSVLVPKWRALRAKQARPAQGNPQETP